MPAQRQEVFVDVVVSFQFTIEPEVAVSGEDQRSYFADKKNQRAIRRAAEESVRMPRDEIVGTFNEDVQACITEITAEETIQIKEVV